MRRMDKEYIVLQTGVKKWELSDSTIFSNRYFYFYYVYAIIIITTIKLYYFYYRHCATTFLCTYIFLNSYTRDELIMTCEKKKRIIYMWDRHIVCMCVRMSRVNVACGCAYVYVYMWEKDRMQRAEKKYKLNGSEREKMRGRKNTGKEWTRNQKCSIT